MVFQRVKVLFRVKVVSVEGETTLKKVKHVSVIETTVTTETRETTEEKT